jgi:hypothetical protein
MEAKSHTVIIRINENKGQNDIPSKKHAGKTSTKQIQMITI